MEAIDRHLQATRRPGSWQIGGYCDENEGFRHRLRLLHLWGGGRHRENCCNRGCGFSAHTKPWSAIHHRWGPQP
eukprot:321410-Heterocapsa_arctica.AAC.1